LDKVDTQVVLQIEITRSACMHICCGLLRIVYTERVHACTSSHQA
jgi:hypothetical protein